MTENSLNNYFLNLPEAEQQCFLYLRDYLKNFNQEITEHLKFNVPFYYYKNKWLCYFTYQPKTKQSYIGFVDGKFLKHKKLEFKGRTLIKQYNIIANEDLRLKELDAILTEAIAFKEKKLKKSSKKDD